MRVQRIYDITRTLSRSIAVWPGDTPFSTQVMMDMDMGDPANVTTLTISSHCGTHVDAPYHFVNDEVSMEQVPLDIYVGPATVITVQRLAGPLTVADFPDLDWDRVERLLVHSAASEHPLDQFLSEYVYPSPELADFMGETGVILFGSDAASMDTVDSETLPNHHALQRNGIFILENLALAGVPDGEYELIALPLKIEGGDGSPVRAILRK
jgi:arylformamidase